MTVLPDGSLEQDIVLTVIDVRIPVTLNRTRSGSCDCSFIACCKISLGRTSQTKFSARFLPRASGLKTYEPSAFLTDKAAAVAEHAVFLKAGGRAKLRKFDSAFGLKFFEHFLRNLHHIVRFVDRYGFLSGRGICILLLLLR